MEIKCAEVWDRLELRAVRRRDIEYAAEMLGMR